MVGFATTHEVVVIFVPYACAFVFAFVFAFAFAFAVAQRSVLELVDGRQRRVREKLLHVYLLCQTRTLMYVKS